MKYIKYIPAKNPDGSLNAPFAALLLTAFLCAMAFGTVSVQATHPSPTPSCTIDSVSPSNPEAPATVSFTGSYHSENISADSHSWWFGNDGTMKSGGGGNSFSTSHSFSQPGTYLVSLTVSDLHDPSTSYCDTTVTIRSPGGGSPPPLSPTPTPTPSPTPSPTPTPTPPPSSARPFFDTVGSSIHAGGALNIPCSPGDSAGITGQRDSSGNNGSKATYIASASGSPITNFGSGDSPGGDNLTVGNVPPTGHYTSICRPDLVAEYREPANGTTVSGITFRNHGGNINNQSQFNALNNNSIYRVNGDLNIRNDISVPAGKRVTFVASGNIYIGGNITYAGSPWSGRNQIPAIGFMAGNGIHIAPDVDQLRGAYYAGSMDGNTLAADWGLIDTCGRTGPVANRPDITTSAGINQCDNQLTVRGAMIAHAFHLRRTAGSVD